METKYEAVFCIVNAGFSDDVMTAARRAGAGGGTVLKGRGSAPREAEELFRITIQSLGFKAVAANYVRRKAAVRRILSEDDAQIIYFR